MQWPGLAGASWAIVATAVVAMVAVVVVAQVPIVPATGAPRQFIPALRAGLALLWRVRPLRSVTVATTVSQLSFGLIVVAFPLLAHDLGHARAAGGLLFSVFAVGALVGSVSYARIAARVAEEPAAMVGFVVFAVALGAIAAAPTLQVALVASFVAGLIDGPLLAATLNLRQRHAPGVAAHPGIHDCGQPQDRCVCRRIRAWPARWRTGSEHAECSGRSPPASSSPSPLRWPRASCDVAREVAARSRR